MQGNLSSLSVGSSEATSGVAVCAACHADKVQATSGPHRAVGAPDSPAGIVCLACHAPHTSTIDGLIRSEVRVGGTVLRVDSQAALCRTCHTETAAGTVSSLTKHATVSEDTSVAAVAESGSACASCHEPHSGTIVASGDALCLGCHAAEGLSYPDSYSFRGAVAYESSGHRGITSSTGYRVVSSESAGFGAWESTTPLSPRSLPGTQVSSTEATRLVLVDGAVLQTDLQTVDGQSDYQLFRFPVGVSLDAIRTARVQWAGSGARRAGYSVLVSVWDAVTESWTLGYGNHLPSQEFAEFAIDPATDVDADGSVWVLVEAMHDTEDVFGRSLTTDYVGLILGYEGTSAPGSCTVCHSMHGSSVDGTMPVGQVLTNEARLCTGDGATGCHGVGAVDGPDVAADFTASIDPKSHHDVMPEAQAEMGTSVLCSHCHNPHMNSASAPYSDPDDTAVSAKVGVDAAVTEDGFAYLLVGAKHDGNPPVISSVVLDAAGNRAAAPLLTWKTDEKATSWVEWRAESTETTTSTGNDALVEVHSVDLSGLEVGETYRYRIVSADAVGNVAFTPDAVHTVEGVPPASPTISAVTYDMNGTSAPVPATGFEGAGPLRFTATATPSDPALQYQFVLQDRPSASVKSTISAWLDVCSWEATTTADVAQYQVRARVRVKELPAAVSAWSEPFPFDYTDTTTEQPVTDDVTRVAGANRYDTAIQASKEAFDAADTVVVATGENFPDALGGAALAGAVSGPILLTPAAAIPASVLAEIDRLNATDIYVLGGTGAVSAAAFAQLDAAIAGTPVRLGGADRYATAVLVAAETIDVLGDGYDGGAFLATGVDFPDALAASPIMYAQGMPLILSNAAGAFAAPAEVDFVEILGGTGVVPASVETALGALFDERLAGANRYATAVAVAEYGVSLGMTWEGVGIATGQAFPDALSAGAALGSMNSVMLLTTTTSLSSAASGALMANRAVISVAFVIGGTGAVSDDAVDDIEAILAGIAPAIDQNAPIEFLGVPAGLMRVLTSSAATTEGAGDDEGIGETPWLIAHEPIEYYIPGAYSVDSNLISLAIRRSDGSVSYIAADTGWESAGFLEGPPTPTAPGTVVSPSIRASVSARDVAHWQTSLATSDGEWNWQVAQFDLRSVRIADVSEVTYLWTGHGEPTPGYPTELRSWDAVIDAWVPILTAELSRDTDASHTVASNDSSEMCLRCHDGLPPAGVVFPAGMTVIAQGWTSATGDYHGARAGDGFGSGELLSYGRGWDALQCTTCHDAHGTANVYHIPATVNGLDVSITDGKSLGSLCVACHRGGIDAWHRPCAQCHDQQEDAARLASALPTNASDCTECHGHSQSWTHPATADGPGTYGRTF